MSGGTGLSSSYWLSGAAVLLIAGIVILIAVNVGGGVFFLALAALALFMALRKRS